MNEYVISVDFTVVATDEKEAEQLVDNCINYKVARGLQKIIFQSIEKVNNNNEE